MECVHYAGAPPRSVQSAVFLPLFSILDNVHSLVILLCSCANLVGLGFSQIWRPLCRPVLYGRRNDSKNISLKCTFE